MKVQKVIVEEKPYPLFTIQVSAFFAFNVINFLRLNPSKA